MGNTTDILSVLIEKQEKIDFLDIISALIFNF